MENKYVEILKTKPLTLYSCSMVTSGNIPFYYQEKYYNQDKSEIMEVGVKYSSKLFLRVYEIKGIEFNGVFFSDGGVAFVEKEDMEDPYMYWDIEKWVESKDECFKNFISKYSDDYVLSYEYRYYTFNLDGANTYDMLEELLKKIPEIKVIKGERK